MNGSPLFTGDAGSGESEIRRWILENDLLEALIALPERVRRPHGAPCVPVGAGHACRDALSVSCGWRSQIFMPWHQPAPAIPC